MGSAKLVFDNVVFQVWYINISNVDMVSNMETEKKLFQEVNLNDVYCHEAYKLHMILILNH